MNTVNMNINYFGYDRLYLPDRNFQAYCDQLCSHTHIRDSTWNVRSTNLYQEQEAHHLWSPTALIKSGAESPWRTLPLLKSGNLGAHKPMQSWAVCWEARVPTDDCAERIKRQTFLIVMARCILTHRYLTRDPQTFYLEAGTISFPNQFWESDVNKQSLPGFYLETSWL